MTTRGSIPLTDIADRVSQRQAKEQDDYENALAVAAESVVQG
jgi:hypothetical protein